MNDSLEQALILQNRHWQGTVYAHQFKRLHNETVIADLDVSEIQIITGIRRCGKSTLLETVINHLLTTVDPKTILYVNFDDPSYTHLQPNAAELYSLITTAEKVTGQVITYLLLDEIQNITGWEKYVKSAYDSQRFKKIIVTGSNGDLLNSDYATLLSGRYLETRIYPLSYRELLVNNNITDQLSLQQNKSHALALLSKMLIDGGFPRAHAVVDARQRKNLLKSYYETILLKDCIKDSAIRDNKLFMQLTHYLINQVSSLYSYNSLKKVVGSNENTIQNFIQLLQDAHILYELKTFSYSLKRQTKTRKKIYCIDNGLIDAVSFKFSNNYGKQFENLVFTELLKIYGDSIYFYNEQRECDFIIHYSEQTWAIQVCYQLNAENRGREIAGLEAAMQSFSSSDAVIITYDQTEVIKDRILVTPFWQFFAGINPAQPRGHQKQR